MDRAFPDFAAERLSAASMNSYLSGLRSIEAAYGDLDQLHEDDGFAAVFTELAYSSSDDRQRRENPSRIAINANLYKQLSNLRSHLRFYLSFKDGAPLAHDDVDFDATTGDISAPALSLEVDLQRALRGNIEQIEPGLTVIDGGAEKRVESGFIDILAQDGSGQPVVIELKAVTARRDVLGQIAAYMADIEEGTGQRPRGILIAPEFDARLVSGARMIEGLSLMRYGFAFSFAPV